MKHIEVTTLVSVQECDDRCLVCLATRSGIRFTQILSTTPDNHRRCIPIEFQPAATSFACAMLTDQRALRCIVQLYQPFSVCSRKRLVTSEGNDSSRSCDGVDCNDWTIFCSLRLKSEIVNL
jgi:hypothetical protein